MNRSEIIQRLKAVEPDLRAHGMGALYLFGSYARDEARPESDIDVFVDPAAFGFDTFMDAYNTLRSALPEHEIGYSPIIEREAVRIF